MEFTALFLLIAFCVSVVLAFIALTVASVCRYHRSKRVWERLGLDKPKK